MIVEVQHPLNPQDLVEYTHRNQSHLVVNNGNRSIDICNFHLSCKQLSAEEHLIEIRVPGQTITIPCWCCSPQSYQDNGIVTHYDEMDQATQALLRHTTRAILQKTGFID